MNTLTACTVVIALYAVANIGVYALFAKDLKEVRRLEKKYGR